MKKFIALCLLAVPIMAFAEDDFGVNVPEWKDFAPSAFINVQEPKGLGKLNTTSRYWYERRAGFEIGLKTCKELAENDERFDCYEKLKVKQYKLNNDYNARLEAKINERSSVPGMNSATDNMLPIGGYLNQMTKFMPSEIQ